MCTDVEIEVILAHKIQLYPTVEQAKYFAQACGTARFVFRRQLDYKSKVYGTEVVVAPKFYPSSKTCSNCGHVKAELSLAERTYTCSECGLEVDRDLNAARNLSRLGLSRSYACGHCVSPASTEAVVAEAGTRPCTLVYTN